MKRAKLLMTGVLLTCVAACAKSPTAVGAPARPHFDTGYGVGSGNRTSSDGDSTTVTRTTTTAAASSSAAAGAGLAK